LRKAGKTVAENWARTEKDRFLGLRLLACKKKKKKTLGKEKGGEEMAHSSGCEQGGGFKRVGESDAEMSRGKMNYTRPLLVIGLRRLPSQAENSANKRVYKEGGGGLSFLLR